VSKLAIEVKNQLKGRRSFHTSLTKDPSTHNGFKIPPLQIKALEKGKGITIKPTKRLEGKKCLEHLDFGHFKPIIPIERLLPSGKWKRFIH